MSSKKNKIPKPICNKYTYYKGFGCKDAEIKTPFKEDVISELLHRQKLLQVEPVCGRYL